MSLATPSTVQAAPAVPAPKPRPVSTEKLFRFFGENMRTGEITGFIGQGVTVEAALKDAIAGVRSSFRSNSSGKFSPPIKVGVTLKDGRIVHRTLDEWESDEPYREEPPSP